MNVQDKILFSIAQGKKRIACSVPPPTLAKRLATQPSQTFASKVSEVSGKFMSLGNSEPKQDGGKAALCRVVRKENLTSPVGTFSDQFQGRVVREINDLQKDYLTIITCPRCSWKVFHAKIAPIGFLTEVGGDQSANKT